MTQTERRAQNGAENDAPTPAELAQIGQKHLDDLDHRARLRSTIITGIIAAACSVAVNYVGGLLTWIVTHLRWQQ